MAISYVSVLAAAVSSWIFGAVFYGALGKQWMAALGWSAADMTGPDGKRALPVVPMIVSFVGELVMAAIFAGLLAHLYGTASIRGALISGAVIWLGFVAPALATNYAYQKAKPALTLIDSAHWLGVLLTQALVLGALD